MLQSYVFTNACHIQEIKNIGNDQINHVSNPGGKSTWELPQWQVGIVDELLKFAMGPLEMSELIGAICWVALTWHLIASRLQFSRIAESHTAESLFPSAVLHRIHWDYVLIQIHRYMRSIISAKYLVISAKWRTEMLASY